MLGRFLNVLGICIVVGIILISIPFLIPKLVGYEAFSVLSGSMEPTYKIGCIIYVKPVNPTEIKVGDAITFHMSADTETVATHRVVSIDTKRQAFETKGDANESKDAMQVSYQSLIGKVVTSIPMLGNYSQFIQSVPGMITGGFLFIIAILLWVIAAMLKTKKV